MRTIEYVHIPACKALYVIYLINHLEGQKRWDRHNHVHSSYEYFYHNYYGSYKGTVAASNLIEEQHDMELKLVSLLEFLELLICK